jgi:hypothetical protein
MSAFPNRPIVILSGLTFFRLVLEGRLILYDPQCVIASAIMMQSRALALVDEVHPCQADQNLNSGSILVLNFITGMGSGSANVP